MQFPGRDSDEGHYERVDAGNGTLMRHFLHSALTPGTLPGCVQPCAAAAQLIADTRAAQRL